MKKYILILAAIIALCSCVKHTEVTIESIDLTGSVWMAYEVDNKELSKDEQFMFYFLKSQTLQILLMSPALLELCVNVCLSILRAKNTLGFRTLVLFFFQILQR